MNDRRLLKPLVRRPGGTEWQDISWGRFHSTKIAARVKKTRDETFIEKDARPHRQPPGIRRLIGGCTDTTSSTIWS